jgi:hypothetical protein
MVKIKTKRERIKFASDNVTGACPEVLDSILKATYNLKTAYKLSTFLGWNKMFSCLTWVLFQKINVINNFLKLIIRNIFI